MFGPERLPSCPSPTPSPTPCQAGRAHSPFPEAQSPVFGLALDGAQISFTCVNWALSTILHNTYYHPCHVTDEEMKAQRSNLPWDTQLVSDRAKTWTQARLMTSTGHMALFSAVLKKVVVTQGPASPASFPA